MLRHCKWTQANWGCTQKERPVNNITSKPLGRKAAPNEAGWSF
jgi:hypothetical protein